VGRRFRPPSWRAKGSAGFDSPTHSAAQHGAQVIGHCAQHITNVQIRNGEGGLGVSPRHRRQARSRRERRRKFRRGRKPCADSESPRLSRATVTTLGP
jgi:hypothetical protein